MTAFFNRQLIAFGYLIQAEAGGAIERSPAIPRGGDCALLILDVNAEWVRQANGAADHFIKIARETDLDGDNDGTLLTILESAREAVAQAHAHWKQGQPDALDAPLADSDELLDATPILLHECAALHDRLNILCEIVREKEADQDQTLPGSFDNADDLFTAMGV